jgi:hypothetical protein
VARSSSQKFIARHRAPRVVIGSAVEVYGPMARIDIDNFDEQLRPNLILYMDGKAGAEEPGYHLEGLTVSPRLVSQLP